MSDSAILILNAGSSSLKFSLVDAGDDLSTVVSGQCATESQGLRWTARDANRRPVLDKVIDGARLRHESAVDELLDWLRQSPLGGRPLVAAGHRVVHGGVEFDRPVLVTAPVLEKLDALVPLAPLHQPHHLAAIRALAKRQPNLPQVACFDTSFHRAQSEIAQLYPLPRRWLDQGIRAYGFHGLSYEHVVATIPTLAGETPARMIAAHLGAGASLAAIAHGRSVASSMGFTALDGVPMATRTGSIDPGVILYFLNAGMTTKELEHMLYFESGLLGISELSGDMRILLASESPKAAQAVEVFVDRIAREIGSQSAALGGLDALVFTGGIGENSAVIRERIVERSAWLGCQLDRAANAAGGPLISVPGAAPSLWVIPADEEAVIARHVKLLLREA